MSESDGASAVWTDERAQARQRRAREEGRRRVAEERSEPSNALTVFCAHCGKPVAEGDHARCEGARGAIEPPRFCPECARRMVVQVTPAGWSARCSRHGDRTSYDAPTPTD